LAVLDLVVYDIIVDSIQHEGD
ncbi:unnamed protein product, partial [Rotaria sordida]